MNTNVSISENLKINTQIVDRNQWVQARKAFAEKEQKLYQLHQEVAQGRRALPRVKIDKNYIFDSPNGKESLSDLFAGRKQLMVQHFMFTPGWEQGCVGCSIQADQVDGVRTHLENRDLTLVVISRTPLDDIEKFRKRMGWNFKWVSSLENDFNYDFHVSFRKEEIATGKVLFGHEEIEFDGEDLPATSVFYKDDDGSIYHTYSAHTSGGDLLLSAYNYLALTPLGDRDPERLLPWVRHHDRYGK